MNRPALLPLTRLTPLSLTFTAVAQTNAPAYEQSNNLLLRWAGVLLVVTLIWFVLYKAVYPYFLRHYRDEFCKTIFWNLFLLYSLTWLFVSSYVLLDFGFYYGWMPWVAVFLAAWWVISGLFLLLRRAAA